MMNKTSKGKVIYTAWYCPNGKWGHFVCYQATQKDIDEHLKECMEKPSHQERTFSMYCSTCKQTEQISKSPYTHHCKPPKSSEPKKDEGEWEMKIEEILRNRILYIGDEIPNYFTTDKRSKQLYLGYPQQLIDELVTHYRKALSSQEERIRKRVKKLKLNLPMDEIARFNYENLKKSKLSIYNRAIDDVLTAIEEKGEQV